MASVLNLVSSAALCLTLSMATLLALVIAAIKSSLLSSPLYNSVIFLSFDSRSDRILPRLTEESTSNSLALDSSSFNLLDLVFLNYKSFYFSIPSLLISSFNLSIIFSYVAISYCALSISCFKIFSLFSPSANCSQSVVLLVSCYLRLSI
jgi:hypothetical protein